MSSTKGGIRQKYQSTKDTSEGTNVFLCCCSTVLALLIVSIVFLVDSMTRTLEIPLETDDLPPPINSSTIPPSNSPSMGPSLRPIQTPSPSKVSPIPSPTSRYDTIYSLVSSVTDPTVLSDSSSPQYRALQWIVDDDPMMVPLNYQGLIQRYILATLYFSTRGDDWKKCGGSNDQSDLCGDNDEYFRFLSGVNECDWFGIQCEIFGYEVKSINIQSNKLRGTIPLEIISLSNVEGIVLSYNSITGQVPRPPPRIRALKLNNNDITGSIPAGLNSLKDLELLSIGNNKMSGTLPTDMFPPSLKNLDLEGNSFDGTIPIELFDSAELKEVDFSSNKLSGTINSQWGSLDNLEVLNLETNRFTGTLPGEIFTPSLRLVSCGLNALSGTIPDGLFNSTRLGYLDVGGNQFNGTISSHFGELKLMKHLIMWQNMLTGTIPKEIGNMRSLEIFQAPYNYLTGEVPTEVCASTPSPLTTLSTDCLPLEDGGEPRVSCSCCNYCSPGYKTR